MFSRVFNLFRRNQNNADDVWLDDNGVSADDEQLDIVVVNGASALEAPGQYQPVRIVSPALQDQIQECQAYLDEMMHSPIPQQHAALTNKFRIYTVLVLGVTLTAVVAPSLLFKIFYDEIFPDVSKFVAECNEQISDLQRDLMAALKDRDRTQAEYNFVLDGITRILRPFIDRWQAYDETDSNCMVNHDTDHQYDKAPLDNVMPGLFCIMNDRFKVSSGSRPARCIDIAREGCAVESQHQDLVRAQRDMEAKNLIAKERVDDIEYRIGAYEYKRDHAVDLQSSSFAKLIVIGGGVLGLIAIVIAALMYRNRYKKHQQDVAPFYIVKRVLPQDANSQEVLALLGRLGIQLADEMTVKDLITQLQAKSSEVDYRWKQRIAFLGGAYRPETQLYSFFQKGGNKDVKRIILEYANLGPVVRPE